MKNSLHRFPISAYIELAKPRILTLVLVTTTIGYFFAGHGINSVSKLLFTLLGAALTCGGSSALNHYLERDADGKMARTRNRPLPQGIIAPSTAMFYGLSLILLGIMVLYWKVNLLTAFLSLLTAFLYVLVYTPMKRLTWLNTTFGAIPGGIPPVGGWAAATGQLDGGAFALFLILFIWQHPHFYAIAWLFKEDYRRAGFKMLPVIEPSGKSTFFQIVLFSVFLIPVSILPTLIGMSGQVYLVGAGLLSCVLLIAGISLAVSKSMLDARKLLQVTVIYLPLLLLLILVDFGF